MERHIGRATIKKVFPYSFGSDFVSSENGVDMQFVNDQVSILQRNIVGGIGRIPPVMTSLYVLFQSLSCFVDGVGLFLVFLSFSGLARFRCQDGAGMHAV